MRVHALLAILSVSIGGQVHALTVRPWAHEVFAQFVDADGNVVQSESDNEAFPEEYVETLTAVIGGSGPSFGRYEASVRMLPSGLFGMSGFLSSPGRLTAGVSVIDEIENTNSVPIDVTMTFIITGGALTLVANENSTLSYQLAISDFGFGGFRAEGTLTGVPAFSPPTFSEAGSSLGGTLTGDTVRIPFSVQRVTFEDIPAGRDFLPTYDIRIIADNDVAEGIFFGFQDPPGLSALVEYSFVPSGPAPAPIPLPPALALAAAGAGSLALLGLRGRREA